MANAQTVTVQNLGDGVNNFLQPNELQPSQSPTTARNIRLDGLSKKPRKGYTTFADELSGGTKIQGMTVYRRASSSNDKLVTTYNTSLYQIDPSTETEWDEIGYSAAFLTGGTSAQSNAATWQAITDGSFRITIDGTAYNVDAIDFTPVTTMADVATRIQLDIRALTGGSETVEWSTNKFIITSGETGLTSAITVTSTSTGTVGTDISGAGVADWMDCDTGNGTVTNAVDFITSDSFINFANYNEWLFLFNGVDKPIRIQAGFGSNPFTKPDSITAVSDFLPTFGDIYLNSLWVSGVPSAANSVFISKAALTDSPEDVYDFSGTLASDASSAQELKLPTRVTAIRPVSTAGVVFTVNEAFYVEGFKDLGTEVVPNIYPIGGANGAVNQQSTVVVENDIYYLTPQKEIKSVKRGFAESLTFIVNSISNNIKNFLQDNLDDDQSSAFGYYDQANKLYKLYVKSKGATFNDLRIVADIRKVDQNGVPEWMIDNAMAFNAGVFFERDAYIGSSVIGQVYKDEDGLADDDDAAIESIWDTKDFTANNPTVLKRYKNVNLFGKITKTTSVTVTIFVDEQEAQTVTIDSNDIVGPELGGIGTQTIGEFTIGDDDIDDNQLFEYVKRIPFRITGKKIKLRFETNDINQNYRVSHMEYSFIPLSKLYNPVGEKL